MATATKARKPALTPASGSSGSLSLGKRVRAANRWREQYNPLAGLKMSAIRGLLDAYLRGEMAEVAWTCYAIEGADPDMIALISRRLAALEEMDWTVKPGLRRAPFTPTDPTTKKPKPAYDTALAEAQAAELYNLFDGIGNLYEAIAHFALATFRGFAHAEKVGADGLMITPGEPIAELRLIDPWNVVRDGLRGGWKLNPDAAATNFASLSDEWLMTPEQFVMREQERWINRIALAKYVRLGLSQKDWDAFIEIYGIPGGVIIGPPNVPEGKESEYQTAAQDVAEGGSGYLPNGADYKPNDGPRGTNPFRDHLAYLTEQLVLAGTGGLLTMLSMPTGIGSGSSQQHADAFATIARSEARRISELFQRQIAAPYLAARFPGKPQLAYFEIAANEETDTSEFVKDVGVLATGGYLVDPAQVEEKTGYKVTVKPPPTIVMPGEDPKPGEAKSREEQQASPKEGIPNRAPVETALTNAIHAAVQGDDTTFAERLQELKQAIPPALTNAAAFKSPWSGIVTPLLNRDMERGGKFALPADGWLNLAPLGEHPYFDEDGTLLVLQVIDETAVAAMVRNRAAEGGELLIDFEHESHDRGKRTTAAGWIPELRAGANGLDMRPRLSNSGKAAIEGGDYRFISPVWLNKDCEALEPNAEGVPRIRPLRLNDAGLTNRPNLKGLTPLSNRSDLTTTGAPTNPPAGEPEADTATMKKLNAKLGLSADASEDAALEALEVIVNRATSAEADRDKVRAEADALKNSHKTLLEAQAESDLDAAGVEGDDRPEIKKQLLANRDGTLAVLAFAAKNSGTKKAAALTNRVTAKTPGQGSTTTKADTEKPLLNRQQEAIAAEKRSGARTNEDAYRAAKAKDPALFAPPSED